MKIRVDFTVPVAVTVFLAIMKLIGIFEISWLLVFAPIWGWLIIVAVLFAVLLWLSK